MFILSCKLNAPPSRPRRRRRRIVMTVVCIYYVLYSIPTNFSFFFFLRFPVHFPTVVCIELIGRPVHRSSRSKERKYEIRNRSKCTYIFYPRVENR